MLVLWKQRLVYLATPKTGTTAIEAALEPLASVVIQRPPELKHTSVHRYWKYLAPFLEKAADEDFMVVAVMREPIDWLRSWYRFRAQDDVEDPGHPMAGVDFAAFAAACVSAEPPPHAQVGTQSAFLAGDGARVERIFRYEDMARFTDFLEERLNCAVSLPRVNVSQSHDTSLSEETEARLRAALARDVALYDSI